MTTEPIDYEALVKARATLYQTARDLAHYGASPGTYAGVDIGMTAAACEFAEEAIFGALKKLAIRTHDQEAKRVLHLKEWVPREESS